MKRSKLVSILICIFIGFINGCIATKLLSDYNILQLITFGFIILFIVSILFPTRK